MYWHIYVVEICTCVLHVYIRTYKATHIKYWAFEPQGTAPSAHWCQSFRQSLPTAHGSRLYVVCQEITYKYMIYVHVHISVTWKHVDPMNYACVHVWWYTRVSKASKSHVCFCSYLGSCTLECSTLHYDCVFTISVQVHMQQTSMLTSPQQDTSACMITQTRASHSQLAQHNYKKLCNCLEVYACMT